MFTTAAAKAETIKTLADSVHEYEAMLNSPKANDLIVAWENGLGIKFANPRKPSQVGATVVGVKFASRVLSHYTPVHSFVNGKGEKAEIMLRSKALKNSILSLNSTIEQLSKLEVA